MHKDGASSRRSAPQITEAQTPAVIEAILFVGAQPLTRDAFLEAFPSARPEWFYAALRSLADRYQAQSRPYHIECVEGTYSLKLTPRHANVLRRRQQNDRGVKLNRATIEVLSIVAYRQPISRQGIEELLAVDAGPALRQLLRRKLVELVPVQPTHGDEPAPLAYRTTERFLELFRLKSVADLPATEDLQEL